MQLAIVLTTLFSYQVEQTPHNIAVVYQTEQLTYRELNQRANQVAHRLQQLGVTANTLVGLSVKPSLEMVVGLLGILKAGGAFVPLDPTYPTDRLNHMVQDSGLTLIVTTRNEAPSLIQQVGMVYLDNPLLSHLPTTNPTDSISAYQLACCLYTSGSTGQPKGVLIEHQAIAAHCLAMLPIYDYTVADRVLLFASLNYVAALEPLFMVLLSGARLVLREPELWAGLTFPAKVNEYGLTVVDLSPEYWHTLLESWQSCPDEVTDLPLQLVILGGDAMRPETVKLWQQSPLCKSARLLNAYGMTETPITATLFQIPAEGEFTRVPIGQAVPNRFTLLLDEELQPMPPGAVGELYIGGGSLARGYLNQPELTAEKFISNPFGAGRLYRTGDLARQLPDSTLEYLGRKDQQVQLRGFRVELGEIEAALKAHATVKDAAVVAQGENKNKTLVAYVVSNHDNLSPELKLELNDYLAQKLPPHAVPNRYVFLKTLPLTPNGKIDRQALLVVEPIKPSLPFRIQLSRYGMVDNLEQVSFYPRNLEPDEVAIETKATSLNFRDVLNALGMLEAYNVESLGIKAAKNVPLGYECAGVIRQVGANVTNFQVGDEVIAYTTGSLASLVLVKEIFVISKPHELSFAEAASIPTIFLTTYYGLKQLAHLKAGDKILIHAASGGVGLAAIQLAQHIGCEIFATASPSKWDYLKSLGIDHIMNSRTLDFAVQVMTLTQGQGVDVVLNSLDKEFITKSFEVLKPGGRFIELGKLAIWSQVQVQQHRPDVSYYPFDLGEVIQTQPTLITSLMNDIMADFKHRRLKPLPTTLFSITQVIDAFRYLAQTKHIGKVVVSFMTEGKAASQVLPVATGSTEDLIMGIWLKVLSLDQVDTQANFFELGGNSLLALEIVNKIQQIFPFAVEQKNSITDVLATSSNILLPPAIVLQHPTIAQLTAELLKINNDANRLTEPVTLLSQLNLTDGWYPQLYNQKECYIWHQQIENKTCMQVYLTIHIQSQVNVTALQKALNALVERHEILQMNFSQQNGVWVQQIKLGQTADFKHFELGCNTWLEVAPTILASAQQLFDLAQGPLLRGHLFSRAIDDHILLIITHHIAIDATAFAILLTELWPLYQSYQNDSPITLPPITATFTDFVKWQSDMLVGMEGQRLKAYWQNQLAGDWQPLHLPTDYPRYEIERHYGAYYPIRFDMELIQPLRQLAQNEGGTLNMVFMTAFQLFLHHYTKQNDLVVSMSISNRTQPAFSHTVGYLADIVPIRIKIADHEITFRELLQQVRLTMLEAINHQGYPINLLAQELKLPSEPSRPMLSPIWFTMLPHQLFQETATLLQPDSEPIEHGDLRLMGLDIIPPWLGIWYELELDLIEYPDMIIGTLNYNSDLFTEVTIAQWVAHLRQLLKLIATNPNQPID